MFAGRPLSSANHSFNKRPVKSCESELSDIIVASFDIRRQNNVGLLYTAAGQPKLGDQSDITLWHVSQSVNRGKLVQRDLRAWTEMLNNENGVKQNQEINEIIELI